MAECIDRDELLLQMWRCKNMGCLTAKSAVRLVEGEPAVDVAPVAHAHWKYVKRLPDGSIWDDYVCSKCGQLATDAEAENWFAYCPVCGAKMDEESKK